MSEILSHPIPAVIILLGLLVFVHEFGHYIVGRMLGIAVEIFSIGFGPQIISWSRQGTNYRLSWIPLGGYVKFAGSHPSEDVPEGLKGIPYREASLGARAMTIAAGPVANFLLAVLVFGILGAHGIPHPPPLVGEVIDQSRAEAAGMLPGDQIVEIDGEKIKTWRELEQKIAASPEKMLRLKVLRNVLSDVALETESSDGVQAQGGLTQKEVELELTPAEVETPQWLGVPGKGAKMGRAGIALGQLPPIVTVRSTTSFAAQKGFKTGDQILSAEVLTSGNDKAQSLGEIKSFWSFREAMVSLVNQQLLHPQDPLTVRIKVKSTEPKPILAAGAKTEGDLASVNKQPVSGAVEKKSEEREILLELAELAALQSSVSGLNTAAGALRTLSSKEAMGLLGLEDSQLTLGAIPEGYKEFQSGDVIIRFGEKDVQNIYQLREALMAQKEPSVEFVVIRQGEEKKVKVSLEPVEVQRMEGKVTHYAFPVGFWAQLIEPEPYVEKYSWFGAVQFGFLETGRQIKEMTINVGQLVTGQIPMKALGGPMLIAKVAGDSAKRGWQTFLGAMALISINLGVLNLFPIPVLDGGQLLMVGWEAVRRRPVSELVLENFQKIGFAMILALVVLATYNDLSRFWISMLSSVVGIFK